MIILLNKRSTVLNSRYLHAKEGTCPRNADITICTWCEAPGVGSSALISNTSRSSGVYLKPEENPFFYSAGNSGFSSDFRRPPLLAGIYLHLIVFT